MSDQDTSPLAGSGMVAGDIVYGRRAGGPDVQFTYGEMNGLGATGAKGDKGDKGDTGITGPTTPASAAATGVAGTLVWDTGFIYVCTATNTWKRVAIATW